MGSAKRHRAKQQRTWHRGGALGLLLVAVLVGAAWMELFWRFPKRPLGNEGVAAEVVVAKGAGPVAIAQQLSAHGLTAAPQRLAWWLRLSGQYARIRAGTYALSGGMSPAEVVAVLSQAGGDRDRGVRVTLPEGKTLVDMGAIFEAAGLVSAANFLAAATDSALMQQLDIPFANAEGYLFPDTYFFKPDATPVHIVTVLHQRLRDQLLAYGLLRSRGETAQRIILASIVEGEARVRDEAPLIAGVYQNRLNPALFPLGRLQADPTVAYGCNELVRPRAPSCATFKGTLGKLQLADSANPYNTYRHAGLPPGPICAPSLPALQAAFHPADTPYLYFVAGEGGRHRFAQTLEAHNRNVQRYREAQRAARVNEP